MTKMRTRLIVLTAALLLASAGLARAQAQQTPTEPAPTLPFTGWVDFGPRISSTSGDAARFERYRDLRSGVNTNAVLSQERSDYTLGFKAENIGYRDGRYQANFSNSKLAFSFMWDSIPLNYSYLTLTPWKVSTQGSTADLTIDPTVRELVQNKNAVGILCAPGAPAGATCSSPSTVASALASTSIYRSLAQPFDIQAKRDTMTFGLSYAATEDISALFSLNTYKRGGNMPYGASFAFNNGNELPIPLDNRTTDLSAGLEWANKKGMLRVGWDGSWYSNNIDTLVWDNPLFATDFCKTGISGQAPGTCYDPSGYSNGNGPAQGRLALPPSNNMNVISATGHLKLPSHSTLNGTFSITSMNQNAALIPWTINPVIANPTVYASFPGLGALPRSTAEANVRGYNAAVNFTTRPDPLWGLTVRYRYNDHENRTPIFDATEYVRFDAVPEETGGETEPFNIKRNTFSADASFNLVAYTQLKVGYAYDRSDRTGRAFSNTADNTLRASVDMMGNELISLRGIYEYTRRKGSGFDEMALEDGGAQGGLRFYDEADRTRNRGTLLLTVTPNEMIDLTFSFAAGKDTYNGPGMEFGLLNNKNTAYNIGFNVTPKPQLAFGANYGRDQYTSLQKSRNANPPPDPSWTDPNRDWYLDGDEKVNSVDVYLDLKKAIAKTDIRFDYNYSDSDNAYIHGGPRITAFQSNFDPTTGKVACSSTFTSCFEYLPAVTNKWHRATVDVRYSLTTKIAVGASYWYEKFNVTDFATVDIPGPNGFFPATGQPRIDYLSGLVTGYGNRPYTGNTGFIRVFYFF
jgi:MtrB/PioB family decaheme-associated outer membrane protein